MLKLKKVDDSGLKGAHLSETTLPPAFMGQIQHLKVKQGNMKIILKK